MNQKQNQAVKIPLMQLMLKSKQINIKNQDQNQNRKDNVNSGQAGDEKDPALLLKESIRGFVEKKKLDEAKT